MIVLLTGWWFSLPQPLFSDPASTVITSREGILLGAHIAADGQWRFPETDKVPEKYRICLLAFEDRYFYRHPGVNPFAVVRALVQNIRSGTIVSGGSTITMQLIRLSRKGKRRSAGQKLIEMALAVRAELSWSKDELLALYASHAPFGGNVVGLGAASWRYYGRTATELSWGEAATLAVLPNAPSLIYPGKKNNLLLKKRNRLLDRLEKQGALDAATCELAKSEPLPEQIFAIPRAAPHLLDLVTIQHPGENVVTTVNHEIQLHSNELLSRYLALLKANEIHNAAALVMDVKSGEVLAYVGNSPDFGGGLHGEAVDIIRSPRSSGSILKPFLYAAMLDDGMILPSTLVPDIPTQIGGFSPQNFSRGYAGAVPASMALSHSLNIPAVLMLKDYRFERFYALLKKMNFSTLRYPAAHYGLSLILGGAEVNLWDLAGAYASLGRLLIRYEEEDGLSREDDFREPVYTFREGSERTSGAPPVSAGAAWLTLEALLKVNRPDAETGWESFASSRQVAWKTGTSFGFRDAWAIGLTRDFLVAVWCGNADGEGRPSLTGTAAAAPLMFDLFNLLPAGKWYTCPDDQMRSVPVCRESGYRAGMHCQPVDTVRILAKGLQSGTCPYHRMVHLDPSGMWQASSECIPVSDMIHRSWFVLPPAMEWYYKSNHPFYRSLPPFHPDCPGASVRVMEMIYPRENNQVFVPVQLDGSPGEVILEAVHSASGAVVYWSMDEVYLGQTAGPHRMVVNPSPGKHRLTLTDNRGNQLTKDIFVAKKP